MADSPAILSPLAPFGNGSAGGVLSGQVSLLHRLDAPKREALRITTDRDRLRAATFLDGRERFWDAQRVETVEPVTAGRPLRMILHVGFCGSTLLARLLDRPGEVLALKEPQALSDLASQAGLLAGGPTGEEARRWLFHLSDDLAGLPSPGEALLLKPSNWVNGFAPVFAADGLIERALFLSMDRRAFIAACFRGGRARLVFATRLAALLAPHCPEGERILASALHDDGDPLARMARVSALLHAQQEWLFNAASAQMAPGAWGRLDLAELQRAPLEACRTAARVLDLPAPDEDARFDEVTSRHSKDASQPFSAEQRRKEDAEVERHHAARFDAALDWLQQG